MIMVMMRWSVFVDAALTTCDTSLSQDFNANTVAATIFYTDEGDCDPGEQIDLVDDLNNKWLFRGDDYFSSMPRGINLCEAWSNSSAGRDPFDHALVANFIACVLVFHFSIIVIKKTFVFS